MMKKLIILKDIFALLMASSLLIMIILVSENPLSIKTLFIMLLPIGMSRLVWNKTLYDAIIHNKNPFYSKSNLSYFMFMLIGLCMSAIAFLVLFKRTLLVPNIAIVTNTKTIKKVLSQKNILKPTAQHKKRMIYHEVRFMT